MVCQVLMTRFSVSKLPGPSEEISNLKWKCAVASKCLAVRITIAITQLGEKYSCESSGSKTQSGLAFWLDKYIISLRDLLPFTLSGIWYKIQSRILLKTRRWALIKFVSSFSGRSVGNTDFDLLLKTDDDCYIDVDSVLMKIDHKGLKRRNFWWGK